VSRQPRAHCSDKINNINTQHLHHVSFLVRAKTLASFKQCIHCGLQLIHVSTATPCPRSRGIRPVPRDNATRRVPSPLRQEAISAHTTTTMEPNSSGACVQNQHHSMHSSQKSIEPATSAPKPKKAAYPRNPHACERCRTRKIRCDGFGAGNGCGNCRAWNLECRTIIAPKQARPRPTGTQFVTSPSMNSGYATDQATEQGDGRISKKPKSEHPMRYGWLVPSLLSDPRPTASCPTGQKCR
jgi:hypothetical protein